jgi:uncharacterized protein YeaO (DUF488 family)
MVMSQITIRRIYHELKPSETNQVRILVDRLWPRGIKKEEANIDYWFKEVAPSHELRKWFGHRTERFETFRIKYLEELQTDATKRKIVQKIAQIAKEDKVVLLYGAKDEKHNNATVLLEELEHLLKDL